MNSTLETVLVAQYVIFDDSGHSHYADGSGFDEADELLEKLRNDNPKVGYTLYAEIDA